jgi:hypothetical protein
MSSNGVLYKAPERAHRCTRLDALCVAVLIAYFLHFALAARYGGFREDEMMNLWTYWYVGPVQSLFALAKFWTPNYRTGGAIYYLPLYHFFGLNPFPYRVVQISILALSIPIAYYLARLLASSRSVAFLAVLAFCYHPYVADLVFVGAFIYDVLCGFFYLWALTYYIHIREKGAYLRPLQIVLFLVLYVCALNSKEMAVTLPVIVLSYELLKSPRWASWNAFLSWIWRCAIPSLITGALTAIYVYSKIYGTGSITRFDPYRPSYSWHNFITSNARFVGELLYAPEAITPTALLLLWAAVFTYAFLRRDPMLRLMAFWVVVIPLPIAFLLPIRSGGCLYLLLFGWAMIFAKVTCDLIALISRTFMFPGQRVTVDRKTEVMSETHDGGAAGDASILGTLRATAGKTFGWTVRLVLVSLLAVSFALFTDWENRRLRTVPNLLGVGQKVSHVIAAFESLNLQPAPHSTVLLKPDEQLFQNKWHPGFIASLVWNDHSLQIWIDKLSKITPEQLAKVDYIISLSEFEATVIQSPNSQKTK